ncbi:MAG: S-adenosylmethionine:tRNA ribosyltransferase-isomerase [Bacteroidales bacterium]|nr:S-adenosylmethionine:tRNA ribosyltransferase-isomerase [Bacteroidales bacterium]
MIPDIVIEDYSYALPEHRIAKYPLEERDASKLLVYKDGVVGEDVFRNLSNHLPSGAMMVLNNTKVVPARLHFRRHSGARIEIFCLQPILPADYAQIFATTSSCRWKCVVGNLKRWKNDVLHYDIPSESIDENGELAATCLTASLVERDEEVAVVEFKWEGGKPFSSVLEMCGNVPIPPYLNRQTEAIDLERYQTLYAKYRGSVAAPTAGLHFTDRVLDSIDRKGIVRENVCLHVGAGTFLPVKSQSVSGHVMHKEPFVVTLDLLYRLRDGERPLIAVGTTSVRTLESLYYVGVSCIEQGEPREVSQWAPYIREYGYSTKEALSAIILYLVRNRLTELKITTRIIIVPGFKFRLVDMMITNFHQPSSTLILLVSAFVGGDWRTIYDYALDYGFRFLSYGDSSLLFRRDTIQ